MSKLRIGMALAALCALLWGAALADIPPAPENNANTYVFDFTVSSLISGEDRRVIDGYAAELEDRTGVQAVVALVDFLDGEEAGIYAHDLFNAWGIGQKGKNNGLLLLFARGDREVFLYPGSGIDHMLTPAVCDRILADSAVPKLTNGDYSGGLRDAFLAACNRLAQAHGVSLAGADAGAAQSSSGGGILEELFGGLFGSSNGNQEPPYEYTSNSAGNKKEGGGWLGTLVIIVIIFTVLRGGRRKRFGMGGGGGCLPFLLGGFLGNMMGRNRGPFGGSSMRPPMGGFRPGGGFSKPTGGSKPGGFKPSGFKPGGGMGRGGGAGRKF